MGKTIDLSDLVSFTFFRAKLTLYKCETEAELHFSWLKISPVEPWRPSQCQEPLRDPRETQL